MGGTSRISTSTSDNEDSTASLGDSEVLSVQHSVADAIPTVNQRPEDGTQVPSLSRRQESVDVLEDEPPRLDLVEESAELPEEPTPRSSKACSRAGQGDVLAGESSNEDIRASKIGSLHLSHVAVDRDPWELLPEELLALRVPLDESGGMGTCPPEGKLEPSDPGEDPSHSEGGG